LLRYLDRVRFQAGRGALVERHFDLGATALDHQGPDYSAACAEINWNAPPAVPLHNRGAASWATLPYLLNKHWAVPGLFRTQPLTAHFSMSSSGPWLRRLQKAILHIRARLLFLCLHVRCCGDCRQQCYA
jgi:hypothetical protein